MWCGKRWAEREREGDMCCRACTPTPERLACLATPSPTPAINTMSRIQSTIYNLNREMAGEREQQQAEGMMHKVQERAPSLSQIVGLITLFTVGGVLLTMTGLTLTGTVIGLVMVTPVLIFFSPILVPVAIVLFLTVAGFLAAGGLGVAAVTALSWIYRYLRGGSPAGSNQIDYARRRIADTSAHIGNKARDYAGAVQS